jgi:hypothetical protein
MQFQRAELGNSCVGAKRPSFMPTNLAGHIEKGCDASYSTIHIVFNIKKVNNEKSSN